MIRSRVQASSVFSPVAMSRFDFHSFVDLMQASVAAGLSPGTIDKMSEMGYTRRSHIADASLAAEIEVLLVLSGYKGQLTASGGASPPPGPTPRFDQPTIRSSAGGLLSRALSAADPLNAEEALRTSTLARPGDRTTLAGPPGARSAKHGGLTRCRSGRTSSRRSAFGGHCLRVSGAQHLCRMRVPISTIMLLGRWGSRAIERYVQETELEDVIFSGPSGALTRLVERAGSRTRGGFPAMDVVIQPSRRRALASRTSSKETSPRQVSATSLRWAAKKRCRP